MLKPNPLPLVKHSRAIVPVHEELLSHNLKQNNFYEYWSNRKHGNASSANYELYPDDLTNKVDDSDMVEWYPMPNDDEWTITYIKKTWNGPVFLPPTSWCQYGLKHNVIYVDEIPPNKYDPMWNDITPAEWLVIHTNYSVGCVCKTVAECECDDSDDSDDEPWCYENSTKDTINSDKCYCSVGNCALPTFDDSDDSDDDETLQYRKEMEEGCPQGYKTVWTQYGFKYVCDSDDVDIQTKVGIKLLAKSYYDEWTEQKKALYDVDKMSIKEEELWIEEQLKLAEAGEF